MGFVEVEVEVEVEVMVEGFNGVRGTEVTVDGVDRVAEVRAVNDSY